MMKSEFLKLVQKDKINEEDYQLIEHVYTYHPCIDEVHGKKEVANLYLQFGMGIFKDMDGTAGIMKELEDRMNKAKAEYQRTLAEVNSFRNGFKRQ